LRIVLKLTSLLAVEIVVPIEIIVVVDVDVAVAPVTIAPRAAGPSTERKSCRAPRQSHPGVIPRIGVRIIGVRRRRRSVNNLRVVRRDVNYVGLSWLNYDYLLAALDCFGLHCLLRAGF
jgi:hypothetical protein